MSALLLLALNGLVLTRGMFFLVRPATRCFTIDQPKGTPMIFAYELGDADHTVDVNIYYGSSASSSMHISGKKIHGAGHIDFLADNEGEYAFCMHQNSVYETPTRVTLRLTYGYDADYYERIAKQEDYEPVNMEVHRLNDATQLALNEAAFQKKREVDYHAETERINNSLVWWPMLQILILLVAGFFQVDLLKRFFKTNKLI